MFTAVRLVQFAKADLPMDIMLDGIITDVILSQYSNAFCAIEVTGYPLYSEGMIMLPDDIVEHLRTSAVSPETYISITLSFCAEAAGTAVKTADKTVKSAIKNDRHRFFIIL